MLSAGQWPEVGLGAGTAARRWTVWLTVALIAGIIAMTACSPSRLAESVRVLADVQAGDRPSRLKEMTPPPARTAIAYEVAGREGAGDLYLPGDQASGAVVLVPGLTPRGRDDPRIVAFASTLARARFEVLVPDLERMRRLQVSAADAEPIADALSYLGARNAGRPLGLAAVSFAVGPAVLALMAADGPARVDFVITIGGYYDLNALITYVTTGYYRETAEGPWLHRPPKRYGKWVFLLANAGRIENPDDRAALLGIADRKLTDADANIADLTADLGSEGRQVHALITNTNPARVQDLLAALPSAMRQEIAALDLSRRTFNEFRARFVMIHDRQDRIIPAEHTIAFAEALPPGLGDVYLIDSLDHAEPKPPGLRDAIRLIRAVYTVLEIRDR